ncbi:MAG: adenosylcobinamide amidohydrolase [Rhodobacteraceae bacterium]|nr:adenosylcobinamide amidohydrolase [Paracoccaceae bacterium]
MAFAAPAGAQPFAGLHTETGEALGRAVYDAVHGAAVAWKGETAAAARAS